MTQKRKYPGPWRQISRELDERFEISLVRGRIHIHTFYICVYRRTTDRYGNCEDERKREVGPNLGYVLDRLEISDKEASILLMMEGALDLIKRISQRYDFYMWREKEDDRKRRREARAKKKSERDDSSTYNTRMKRVQDKQFGRMVEA